MIIYHVHPFFLQTTVVRKKMYYNMRVKTLRRNMSALLNRLADNKEQLMKGASDRYKALAFTIKEVRKAGYTSKTILLSASLLTLIYTENNDFASVCQTFCVW